MKRVTTLAGVALLVASCESVPNERRAPTAPIAARASIEDLAAQAETASRPGPKHRALDPLVGAWDTASFDVDSRGVESDPRRGHATLNWILTGRFVEWRQSLELATGERSTQGYLGFDTYQNEYQLLMISDLATGMGVARGRGDIHAAGIRFVLDIAQRETGGVLRASSILRTDGADRFVLEQIGADANGAERVVRRTRFTRPKSTS